MKGMYEGLEGKYLRARGMCEEGVEREGAMEMRDWVMEERGGRLGIECSRMGGEIMVLRKKIKVYEENLGLVKKMLDGFEIDKICDLKEFEGQRRKMSEKIKDLMIYDTLKGFGKGYDIERARGLVESDGTNPLKNDVIENYISENQDVTGDYERMLLAEKQKLDTLGTQYRKLEEQLSLLRNDRDKLARQLEKTQSGPAHDYVGNSSQTNFYSAGSGHIKTRPNSNLESNNANALINPSYYDVDPREGGPNVFAQDLPDHNWNHEREKLLGRINELEMKLRLNKEAWSQERQDF